MPRRAGRCIAISRFGPSARWLPSLGCGYAKLRIADFNGAIDDFTARPPPESELSQRLPRPRSVRPLNHPRSKAL